MVTRQLRLQNQQETIRLFGEQESRLRELERDFGVEILLRQDAESGEIHLNVRGAAARVEKASRRLREEIEALRRRAAPVDPRGFEPLNLDAPAIPADGIYRTQAGRVLRARTKNQQAYIDKMLSHELTIGLGPAGTGKTFLAVAAALRTLESRKVARIVLSRPVVEAGERLGFLPGDLLEKVNPYLRPLYDAFLAMIGPERFRSWRDEEVLEIVPLAYMRGRTFEDAFMILDEAQNTTPEQMKMFLTRIGTGSKAVVTGDPTQNDLPPKAVSGLADALDKLSAVTDIAVCRLDEADVQRHPLVRKIITAYERGGRAS